MVFGVVYLIFGYVYLVCGDMYLVFGSLYLEKTNTEVVGMVVVVVVVVVSCPTRSKETGYSNVLVDWWTSRTRWTRRIKNLSHLIWS